MKKLIIILIVVLIVTFTLFAVNSTGLEADKTAIKKVALKLMMRRKDWPN